MLADAMTKNERKCLADLGPGNRPASPPSSLTIPGGDNQIKRVQALVERFLVANDVEWEALETTYWKQDAEAKRELDEAGKQVRQIIRELQYSGLPPDELTALTPEYRDEDTPEAHLGACHDQGLALLSRLRALLGDGGEIIEKQRVEHALDFTWIRLPNGTRYDFSTVRQREIMKVLYEAWERGGDGAPVTESAMIEAINPQTTRLRVADRFKSNQALDDILRRREAREATWALFLHESGT